MGLDELVALILKVWGIILIFLPYFYKFLSLILMPAVVLYGIIIGLKKIPDSILVLRYNKLEKIYENWKKIIKDTLNNKPINGNVVKECWNLYDENEDLLFIYFKNKSGFKDCEKFHKKLKSIINSYNLNGNPIINSLSKSQKEKIKLEVRELINLMDWERISNLCTKLQE